MRFFFSMYFSLLRFLPSLLTCFPSYLSSQPHDIAFVLPPHDFALIFLLSSSFSPVTILSFFLILFQILKKYIPTVFVSYLLTSFFSFFLPFLSFLYLSFCFVSLLTSFFSFLSSLPLFSLPFTIHPLSFSFLSECFKLFSFFLAFLNSILPSISPVAIHSFLLCIIFFFTVSCPCFFFLSRHFPSFISSLFARRLIFPSFFLPVLLLTFV